jgi:uncharacterized membrane protein
VEGDDARPLPSLERVSAFSDGIFAIAITILILPLTDVQVRDGQVVSDLLALGHQFLALVVSFAVIGGFWVLHHDDLTALTSASRRLLVANLVFLFFVVMLPFPTALLGAGDSVAATVIYAGSIMGTALSSLVLWRVAEKDGLVKDGWARRWGHGKYWGTAAVVAGFLPSVPIAFVSPTWARVSWALAIPFSLLADRIEARTAVQP